MIHRDVLMRQIRQFTEAIASLLGQSHREQPDEVLHAIDEACRTHLDGQAADLRTVPPETLLEMCHEGTQFVAEAAQSLAKVLRKMGEAHIRRDEPKQAGVCFSRSLLLYRRLLQEPEAPVSWKVGTTIAALAERADTLPVDDATQQALEAMRNDTGEGPSARP